MTQIIAELYEIQNKIGAGGGGIVYLGRHLRLEKQVVLKADKRTLSTDTEALRREVDLLKDLSHTYIPQVYDFVQQDGVVYTVMDYIEGESLDKLLGRGQLISQSQIVMWACQLLEALNYLHSRPPYGILHGDIKPANIMLRPNGDVCLIDYNIALALGEEGAVKVGFSRGYASPEHYGADYINDNKQAAVEYISKIHTYSKKLQKEKKNLEDDKTEVLSDKQVIDVKKNQEGVREQVSAKSTTSGQRAILLDVRSDIYSLGATLYHLLSGKRPAQDAREVEVLGADVCSPAVAAIIQKAMSPQPDSRYQTAEEMLTAFLQLYQTDKRVIRHKRRIAVAASMLTLSFLLGGAGTFIGLKQIEQQKEALALSEYSANALANGDVSTAVELALQAIPKGNSILDAPVTAQAQKALTDALGVYDLADGFVPVDALELPSAPFDMVLSPNGSRLAVVVAYEVIVFDLESQQRLATLPAQESALADVVFVDENLLIYAGQNGVTAYDIDTQAVRWTGEIATNLTLAKDGSAVACVNRDATYALIYQVADGAEICRCEFGEKHLSIPANDIFADAEDDIFSLNENGTMLAVSSSDGGMQIYDLRNPEESLILYETSDYITFSGGFHQKYFAYTAGKSGYYEFGLIDVERSTLLGTFEAQEPFLMQANEKGIYLANENVLVEFDAETLEQKELAYTEAVNIKSFSVDEKHVLITTEDDCFAFYDRGANQMSKDMLVESCDFAMLRNEFALLGSRDNTELRLLKLKNHENAQLFVYAPDYMHDEARISHDKKTVLLFDYQKLRICAMDGEVVAEIEFPNAEHIYDQQFRRNDTESYLEVIWYDGTRRMYSSQDGSLISERKGEVPDKSLKEEFITDNYRIVSDLHDPPVVYDLKTGKEVTTLETDAYLTYVTQLGDYIITEYLLTEGEGSRFGLLLNKELETVAVLPKLCDVFDEELIFDYESGNLRHCRLYSLQELITLGETY